MQTTLAAIAVITVGYIFAYLIFDRLRDRYGYVGGAEYVVIGFLLGPRVTGLLDAGQVQDLTPIVSLALGWLGMLLGTYFRVPTMALIAGDHLRVAFAEAVATFGIALAALLALFRYVVDTPWPQAAVLAGTLAAVATLSSPPGLMPWWQSSPSASCSPSFTRAT
jgi:MFS family permease